MPTACIVQSGCRVSLESERLRVLRPNEENKCVEVVRELPIRDLDRVIVAESVQISGQAMAALLRAGIPVNYLSWNGQFLGGFLPASKEHGLARLRQYQRTLDPAFTLAMAGRIVVAKLYNQRRVLQRLQAGRSDDGSEDNGNASAGAESASGITEALKWLDGLFAPIHKSRTIDELRGYEGAATARYFQAWATFLPAEFPFERRSTRPPLNPVNACISFGATVMYHELVAFLHAHGLDPGLGTLHSTEDGRWSLALDLIEPFRPVLIEALALDLFSHQILNASHFEPHQGGVYLNEAGRRKFFLQYERRIERQFLSEAVGHRTMVRQQLEQQAVMYKAALESPEKFEPFLIN